MISAVYVTYNPDLDVLNSSITSIMHQVEKVIVVDNSPVPFETIKIKDSEKCIFIPLQDNIGIAAAQNIGITKSLEDGAEYLMLSDQDTIYPDGYIKAMLEVIQADEKIGAVVPKFMDSVSQTINPFIGVSKYCFKKITPEQGTYEVMQGIASGKIISAKAIRDVGMMDAELFIDWVDLEWCWRLRKKGYKVIGNADVCIQHSLGDKSESLVGRQINVRSPMRHYYITRNAFYLALNSDSIGLWLRMNLFFKSFRYIVAFPIVSKPHVKHLKAVTLGFIDGITGKVGRKSI